MTAPRNGPEAGFTLIEALVALALGAMVVTLALSSLRAAGGLLAGFASRGAQTEALARAGTILSGDTLHARLIRDDAGALFFSGASTEAIFAQAARPTAGWQGLSAVRLTLAPAGGEIALLRSEAPLDAEGSAWSAPVTLWQAPDLAGLRYLDAAGHWVADWRGDTLPRALGVALAGGGPFPVLVAEFPPLIEPGCALPPPAPCSLRAEAAP